MNTFLSKIYWTFYPRVDSKVIYLQKYICGFNLSDDIVWKNYNLFTKYVDYDSDRDLQEWCDVINNSYDDCFFDITKARKFLKEHPIFEKGKTVLFF